MPRHQVGVMYSKRVSVLVFGVAVLLASACDDGDDGSKDDEVGDGDGDGDEAGDGDGDGDIDPTGDGDGDTSGDKGGDFGGDDGPLEGCAAHETAADCQAQADCSPVYGKPLIDDGDGGWCTMSTEEFIGCASSKDLCPGIGKTLCDGDEYWRTTACVPDNLDVCDAPGDITGDCNDAGWA